MAETVRARAVFVFVLVNGSPARMRSTPYRRALSWSAEQFGEPRVPRTTSSGYTFSKKACALSAACITFMSVPMPPADVQLVRHAQSREDGREVLIRAQGEHRVRLAVMRLDG
jgi:hypothetical protein